MKVILFGATGMVGQGVLRECLLDSGVEHVLAVGRRPSGKNDPKLAELVVGDMRDFAPVAGKLAGYDACFFCLGVTSVGMAEDDYRKITYDIPVAAAHVLVELNPDMTFILVTGRGTDSSGTTTTMWARVKGAAENAIFELPFHGKYAFRPAVIEPLHGITSRTRSYRLLLSLFGWLFPVIRAVSPSSVTTTERVGKAMLNVARLGYPTRILESNDINIAAGAS